MQRLAHRELRLVRLVVSLAFGLLRLGAADLGIHHGLQHLACSFIKHGCQGAVVGCQQARRHGTLAQQLGVGNFTQLLLAGRCPGRYRATPLMVAEGTSAWVPAVSLAAPPLHPQPPLPQPVDGEEIEEDEVAVLMAVCLSKQRCPHPGGGCARSGRGGTNSPPRRNRSTRGPGG